MKSYEVQLGRFKIFFFKLSLCSLFECFFVELVIKINDPSDSAGNDALTTKCSDLHPWKTLLKLGCNSHKSPNGLIILVFLPFSVVLVSTKINISKFTATVMRKLMFAERFLPQMYDAILAKAKKTCIYLSTVCSLISQSV